MKVESLIFGIIAVFCVVAAVVYGFWAQEPIGTTALVLSGGPDRPDRRLLLVRLPPHRRPPGGPQGRRDRRRRRRAGLLQPGELLAVRRWPSRPRLMGLALAFWYSWLIVIAGVALLITIGGLLFEYYVGQNATQS